MQKALNYLNGILQGHLKLVVAPGEGYKNFETALKKFSGEKEGRLDEMKDLARIMVVFNDSKLSDIFSYALHVVADYAQNLEGNPFQCSPFPLPQISPKLKLEFLLNGTMRPLPCRQEERCQDSAYYTEYAHIRLLGQPVEIQICHKRMAAVYDVTHRIYAVKRILDEINGILDRMDPNGFSSQSRGEKPTEEDPKTLEEEKEKLLHEMKNALGLAKISLDSFSRPLGEVSHPVLGQEEVGLFQKIMYSVMNVFVKSPVADTFNKKRQLFEKDAAVVLGDSYRKWLDGLCDIHSKHLSPPQKKHLADTIKEIFGITEEFQMSSAFLMDRISTKYDSENLLSQDLVFSFQNDLMSKILATDGDYLPILENNRFTSPSIAEQRVHVARLDDEIRDLRQLCHAASVYGWLTDPEYRRRFASAVVKTFSEMVNPNKQMRFDTPNKPEKQPAVNHFLRDLLAEWGVIERRKVESPLTVLIRSSQGR
jgi:hypothetical protein